MGLLSEGLSFLQKIFQHADSNICNSILLTSRTEHQNYF